PLVTRTRCALCRAHRRAARLRRTRRVGAAAERPVGTGTVYAVPSPRPIVTGPAAARVVALTQQRVRIELSRRGRYRLAIRYSAYWHAQGPCITQGRDGMTIVAASRGGRYDLEFDVDAGGLLAALKGEPRRRCTE